MNGQKTISRLCPFKIWESGTERERVKVIIERFLILRLSSPLQNRKILCKVEIEDSWKTLYLRSISTLSEKNTVLGP